MSIYYLLQMIRVFVMTLAMEPADAGASRCCDLCRGGKEVKIMTLEATRKSLKWA